jgi:hypothetical protein
MLDSVLKRLDKIEGKNRGTESASILEETPAHVKKAVPRIALEKLGSQYKYDWIQEPKTKDTSRNLVAPQVCRNSFLKDKMETCPIPSPRKKE